MKEKAKLKVDGLNQRTAEKYPEAHKKVSHYFGVFKEVWRETFPNTEKVVQDRMAKRKERAKLAREWEEK